MKILLVSFLLSINLFCNAQIDQSKIDKKDLRVIMKILTSDSLEGRGTGSEGQKKAQRFISERFEKLGLVKFDEYGYLEKFKLRQVHWGEVYLKTAHGFLTNFENMVFQGSDAQNNEIEREVVFGGRGTEQELSQINVKDRLVLVFIENLRANYEINARLRQKKAFGVILANPKNEKQFESIKNTFKDYSLQKRLALSDTDTIQIATAKWDTIKFITSITIPNSELKSICGLSSGKLQQLISENKIANAPISKAKIKLERIHDEIETANVIGLIKGKSNQTIVISAHYDHLGKIGKEYFPGADDNASGTAALLELAEEFAQLKDMQYTIMFLATSAEEAGLLGSYYHANHQNFNPQGILCNLNLDMIARSDDKHDSEEYLYCIGTDQAPDLDRLVRKADKLYDKCAIDFSLNNSKDPGGLFTRSDSYNFYRKGIPSVQFFSGLHSDYHRPTDTIEKINFDNLANRVRQIGMVIQLLQSEGLEK